MRWMLCLLLGSGVLAGQKITTLFGSGQPGFDDESANNPYGLVIGPDGALYFCDIDNHVVRRLDLKTRKVTTVAGSGEKGNSGDGGPATKAALNQPYEVRFDQQGNMFFVDMPNHNVRRVDARTGLISTIAGTGQAGFSGDGGPAVNAQFRQPHAIVFDREGRLLICDIGNHRVRRIDLSTGLVETYLGGGVRGTTFNGPRAIDVDRAGNLYLALREGNAVYRIDPKTDRATRIAENAAFKGPKGIALSPNGRLLYVADTENHAIRRIDLRSGTVETITADGMKRPHGVFVGRDGAVYVGDSEAHRIRVIR